MTISVSEQFFSGPYAGDGVATVYDYDFKIFESTELIVSRTNADGTTTTLAYGTDYSVAGVGGQGGTITLTSGDRLPTGATMTVEPDITESQDRPLSSQSSLNLNEIEQSLDKLTALGRKNTGKSNRSLKVPTGRVGGVVAIVEGSVLMGGPDNSIVEGPTVADLNATNAAAAAALLSENAAAAAKEAAETSNTQAGGKLSDAQDAKTEAEQAATDAQASLAGVDAAILQAVENASVGGIQFTKHTANVEVTQQVGLTQAGLIADTSGGSFTVTLNETPSTGDRVVIADGGDWYTNNLTVARNGATITGLDEDLTVNVGGLILTMLYDGTTWLYTATSAKSGNAQTYTATEFTATGDQTSFAASYTVALVEVSINGVTLASTDYAATDGANVVLNVGAAANDIVTIKAYTKFEVANAATASQGTKADSAIQNYHNLATNSSGSINERGYVSGTATVGAYEYTIDAWRVVVLGEALTFTGDDTKRVMTAPAGGIRQTIPANKVHGVEHVISWEGSATCKVDGVSVANGGVFTPTANANLSFDMVGGTFSEVQVERGSVATPYRIIDRDVEKRNCRKRYYSIVPSENDMYSHPINRDNGYRFLHIQLPDMISEMPVCNITGGVSGAYASGNPQVTSVTSNIATARLDVTTTSGFSWVLSFTADADFQGA